MVYDQSILRARVPLLKVTYNGRPVDISVNNVLAVHNSRLLRAYSQLMPELAPLFHMAPRAARDIHRGLLRAPVTGAVV